MSKASLPILLWALAGPAAFATDGGATDAVPGRWYSVADLEQGRAIYATYCAGCHGDRGEGQPGWQERDESGYYPAPPLDGTGHSAHHPIGQMLRTLDTGGGPLGGWMPSFSDVLADAEKRAVIAWVQSLWPGDTYQAWLTVNSNAEEN